MPVDPHRRDEARRSRLTATPNGSKKAVASLGTRAIAQHSGSFAHIAV